MEYFEIEKQKLEQNLNDVLKMTEHSSSPDLRKTAVGSSVFLQIGCNYHTKWQSNKAMRFVLVALLGTDKAILQTRVTNKRFTTKVSDLIFIETEHNKKKAKRLSGQ